MSDQNLFGAALVAALAGLAGYYAWRQVAALRRLRAAGDTPDSERRFVLRQIVRRLVGSGLLAVLAVMLGGALLYLEPPARDLIDQIDAHEHLAAGEKPELTPEQKEFRRRYTLYWIALLLVLLAVVGVVAVDMFATRWYGFREFRKIQADRRAMIERQVARLRQERNGHA